METLRALCPKLEADLSKFNCILEVDLPSESEEGEVMPILGYIFVQVDFILRLKNAYCG